MAPWCRISRPTEYMLWWKLEPENRAAALPARRRHRTTVPFDDGFHDRESEAAARRLPCARGIHFVEPIEHIRQMFGCNARSGIADRDDDCAGVERRVQRHAAAFRRVAQRVRSEILERLF